MHVLVYSLKSEYCVTLLDFVKGHEELMSILKFHDVNKFGVPNGVQRVPTLICPDGRILIGSDIRDYLESFLQMDPEGSTNTFGFDINGNDIDGGFFDVNQFGTPLAPKMTSELEQRISSDVNDAYSKLKK
jgi:hypothetical protein